MSTPPVEAKAWWRSYKKANIVARDVEKVSIKALQGVNRMKAATVSIADFNKNIVYRATVYHKRGTFLVNSYTIKCNGFKDRSLENGKPLAVVSSEVAEILMDKLVVTCAGENDFRSLDLDVSAFDKFGLHEYYKRQHAELEDDLQSMSLRDIYFMHFEQDIQRATHAADKDAISAMRIFAGGYVLAAKGTSRNEVREMLFTTASLNQEIK